MKLNIVNLIAESAVAAALIVAGSALGPSIAAAETNSGHGEWDLEKYDACMANNKTAGTDTAYWRGWCCGYSGGTWNGDRCVAPPATAAGDPRRPVTAGPINGGEATTDQGGDKPSKPSNPVTHQPGGTATTQRDIDATNSRN